MVTYSLSDRQPLIANVKEAPEGTIGDMLMASAYLIGFRQEKLGANTIWTAAESTTCLWMC